MTVEEFEDLLKNHDWYYMYANGEAYQKGKKESDKIQNLIRQNPELKKIYDEFRR